MKFEVALLYLIATAFTSEGTRVSISWNYYTNITVSVPGDVPPEGRREVISSLQDFFRNGRSALYRATKKRAIILQVNILIPGNWGEPGLWLQDENATLLYTNGGDASFEDVDIVVTGGDDEREEPYTLQADGCGKRGERIYLPLKFLASEKDPSYKGAQFVHQWSQYRYGVFPEGGFPNDPLYPTYYSVPGTTDVEVTSCTNIPLKYSFTYSNGSSCSPVTDLETGRSILESGECLSKPVTDTKAMDLKSSLMDPHALSQASQFCDSDLSLDKSHNFRSPSKHNALCSEEATWNVILRNEDFARGRNVALRYRFEKQRYHFIQEQNLRIVIVIDVSSRMAERARYRLVKNVLAKFILQDVPEGSDVGLVFAGQDAVVDLRTLSTTEIREEFLQSGNIPDEPTTETNICTGCALRRAIQMLASGDKNGVIIMITASSNLNNDKDYLSTELKSTRLRLSVLQFASTEEDIRDSQTLRSLASSSGGKIVSILEGNEVTTLSHLYLTLPAMVTELISTQASDSTTVYVEELPDLREVSFSATVDKFCASDLIVVITGPEMQPINPFENAEVREPSDNNTGRLSKDVYIPAMVYRKPKALPGKYVFKGTRTDARTPLLAAVSCRPGENGTSVNLRAWISFQKETGYPPIKVFTELRSGDRPVTKARVTVTVYNSTGEKTDSFPLFDNGLGDPDVTRHDGIYSRYFVSYSSPGFYGLLVKAVGQHDTEVIRVAPGKCCGSYMHSAPEPELTGNFTRIAYVSLPIIKAFSPEDAPPSRILDLKVSNLNLDDMVYSLTWTGVGSDYDRGTVSSYEIKLFSERTEAKRRFENSGVRLQHQKEVINFTAPEEYGKRQAYVVQLPESTDSGRYYIAVRAVDEFSNPGAISNIVEVLVINKSKKGAIDCSDAGGTEDDKGPGGAAGHGPELVVIILFTLLHVIIFPHVTYLNKS